MLPKAKIIIFYVSC